MEILINGKHFTVDEIQIQDGMANSFYIKERGGGGLVMGAETDLAICPNSANEIDIYEL